MLKNCNKTKIEVKSKTREETKYVAKTETKLLKYMNSSKTKKPKSLKALAKTHKN